MIFQRLGAGLPNFCASGYVRLLFVLTVCAYFSKIHFGHFRIYEEWLSWELTQWVSEVNFTLSCHSWPHREHVSRPLQESFASPNSWHVKQRWRSGTYGLTLQLMYAIQIDLGSTGNKKVNIKLFVLVSFPSTYLIILRTPPTSWSLRFADNSSSAVCSSSWSVITPREKFRVLWVSSSTSITPSFSSFSNLIPWLALATLISNHPVRIFFLLISNSIYKALTSTVLCLLLIYLLTTFITNLWIRNGNILVNAPSTPLIT